MGETETVMNSNVVESQWKYSFWESCFGLSGGERKYQTFMSKENSFIPHVAMIVLSTLGLIIRALKASVGDYSLEYKVYVIQLLLLLIPGWLHFYAIVNLKYPNSCRPLPIHIIYLGDAVLLSFAVCNGLFLYGMATAPGCDSNPVPTPLICDGYIPFAIVVYYVISLMMLSVLIKCRHFVVVILSIVIEIVFLSIVVKVTHTTKDSIVTIIVVFLVQSFVGIDGDIYSRRVYHLLVESRSSMHAKIMADNENVIMEMQSTELRFLIGNVAHDLKTPLQAFSYELELMKSQATMHDQKCNESILLLESICSFMLMTINRAIDYTKVTSGIKLKPSLETVDVDGVFKWVKMCVARTVASRYVSIVVEPKPANICNFIITDKQWLMENLLCLISNAQKFTTHGSIYIKYSFVKSTTEGEAKCDDVICSEGVKLISRDSSSITTDREKSIDNSKCQQVTANPSEVPPMVMVEVIDDGIGISEEMQQTLFKPFKQAMRRAGGTGLGIYSLSKRVESLGGTCGVSSRADGKSGARFWFTLPYRPDVTVAANLESPPQSPKGISCEIPSFSLPLSDGECKSNATVSTIREACLDAPSSGYGGIMLVEDSPLIQKTCVKSFLREGIKLEISSNGLECVEKVIESPSRYKLLLMDVNMPVMDGLEATERLRQWERNSVGDEEGDAGDIESNVGVRDSKLLIIGLSANSDSQSKQEALDAGMDRFLCKPLNMTVLRDCLKEYGLDLDNFKYK